MRRGSVKSVLRKVAGVSLYEKSLTCQKIINCCILLTAVNSLCLAAMFHSIDAMHETNALTKAQVAAAVLFVTELSKSKRHSRKKIVVKDAR